MIAHIVVLVSGAGPLMMGEIAEQWTASELRRLQRQGWMVVNHFGLAVGDIDHVLVGPPGVFVVESKWSGSGWSGTWAESVVLGACRQSTEAADRLAAWSNFKRLKLPAPRPVVAVWGQGTSGVEGTHDRCEVVAGADLKARLSAFGLLSARLTSDQVEATWRVLSEHLRRRDAREETDSPMPPSLQALAVRAAIGIGAGLASFVGAAYLLGAALPFLAWLVILLVVAFAEQPVRRWARLRPVVTGSQVALALTASLAIALTGAQIVR